MIFLLVAITISTPAIAVVSAEDAVSIEMQSTQKSQAPCEGQVIEGSQNGRPSLRERDAVSQILLPNHAQDSEGCRYEVQFENLHDKPAWFGYERRIVHEMWTDLSGKQWHKTEVSQRSRNEKSP